MDDECCHMCPLDCVVKTSREEEQYLNTWP